MFWQSAHLLQLLSDFNVKLKNLIFLLDYTRFQTLDEMVKAFETKPFCLFILSQIKFNSSYTYLWLLVDNNSYCVVVIQ